MGCSQSLTADDDQSVILIKPKTLKFKSHNSNMESILKKQYTDGSGQAFYIVPTERASFSKVPVLKGPDTNQLVQRRRQSKLSSSPSNIEKAQTLPIYF
ncbi:unnamed protein product (macronuclear) [Paramecium tetraurelia]|uniref:Uncharacterized protein n=2 Tax=Paramecium TaxID=5884 RepID=A0BMB4_PARTE|nr:uncharacterized protein GSPATT00030317001 [Paramecium tetraurelia]CAD8206450.1 unnamed protein product [Paramecium octaurelia]CAK59681.1 unnamed protein product [Paramecium tetraurelia]|eukprot:XP_001427079.1 hypothetical protein (macronuclear) [Paramecium tetraurelia strain d4-2]